MNALPKPHHWRSILKLGMAGLDVTAWRGVLEADHADLSGAPNAFDTSVHNATVGWQKARGLKGDGIVGPATRAEIGKPPLLRTAPLFDPEAIGYREARHWSRQIPGARKDLVVIHCMEYPESATSAEWCADFFAAPTAPQASAHYCVDDDSIICCVPPDRVAWHAPGANHNGIGIEHAGFARQTRAQWLDDFSLRILGLSAELVAWLCSKNEMPMNFVVADHIKAGGRGITTHAEVSKAFGKSSHWDPGPHFPIGEYLRMVLDASRRQRA